MRYLHCNNIARSWVQIPLKPEFFQVLLSQLLKLIISTAMVVTISYFFPSSHSFVLDPRFYECNIGPFGLDRFTQRLHLARISILVRASSGQRICALGSTAKISGSRLQGSKSSHPIHPPLRP